MINHHFLHEPKKDLKLEGEIDFALRDLKHLNRGFAFSSICSTNDYAHKLAGGNFESGTVVITEKQNNGRGRLERRWESRPGDLILSVLLKNCDLPKNLGLIPMMSALAVLRALKKLEVDVKLKWPNDIIIKKPANEKSCDYFGDFYKLGGILVENIFKKDAFLASIIGVGINIEKNPRLKKIIPHMVSLNAIKDLSRKVLLKELLASLDSMIESINNNDFEKSIFKEYRKNCETLGKQVRIAGENINFGYVSGLNTDGSLVVTDGFTEQIVFAGDISILPKPSNLVSTKN